MPAITEHVTTQEERDLLELPVRLGGLGLVNPARTASQEYEASIKITGPLVRQIIKQAHEPRDETEIKTLQASKSLCYEPRKAHQAGTYLLFP